MDEIAKELGRRKKVKVLKALDKKSGVENLKNVHDPNKRRTLLEHSIFYSLEFELPGKRVLLIDDVFRSCFDDGQMPLVKSVMVNSGLLPGTT